MKGAFNVLDILKKRFDSIRFHSLFIMCVDCIEYQIAEQDEEFKINIFIFFMVRPDCRILYTERMKKKILFTTKILQILSNFFQHTPFHTHVFVTI